MVPTYDNPPYSRVCGGTRNGSALRGLRIFGHTATLQTFGIIQS
jgi:hypothetical protein